MICREYSYGIRVDKRVLTWQGRERRRERGKGATSFFDLTPSPLPPFALPYLLRTDLSFFFHELIDDIEFRYFIIHNNNKKGGEGGKVVAYRCIVVLFLAYIFQLLLIQIQ